MSKNSKTAANSLTFTLNKQTKKTKNKPRGSTKPQPQPAPKGRMRKGMLSTGLDMAETFAGVLPGAIKGIRSIFNAKEASFATPASFASVSNNMTQMIPESRVDHPTLGIAGTRFHGSQPLAIIQLGSVTNGFFRLSAGSIPAIIDANTIVLNPIAMGGPMSIQAYLHDRFVFRALKFKYTTYVSTGTVGVCVLNVEKDLGSRSTTSFDTGRMVVPNVVFPYRIPKAELDYVYDGPDLFFCDAFEGGVPTNTATQRQDIQGVLNGYDLIGVAPDGPLMGFLDVEYVIDFFEPVAPVALLGSTDEERLAFRTLRRTMLEKHRSKPVVVSPLLGKDALRHLIDEVKEPVQASAASSASSCACSPRG